MSLQEALREALARKWAEDDAAHKQMEEAKPDGRRFFSVTNNVSRVTFDYIKANPSTRTEATKALVAKGFKDNSVTALIGQMLRAGMMVTDASGFLQVTQPEYTPIPQSHKQAKHSKKVKKVAMPKQPVSSDSAPPPVPAPVPAPAVITNEVEHILNTLPIKQARALYDELHKIFGVAR